MPKIKSLLDQQGVVVVAAAEVQGDHQEDPHGGHHQEEDPHLAETCHQVVVHHQEGVHHQLHAGDPCHQREMLLTTAMTDMTDLQIADPLLLNAADTHPQGIMTVDMNAREKDHQVMLARGDMQTNTLRQREVTPAPTVLMDPQVVTDMMVPLVDMAVREHTQTDTVTVNGIPLQTVVMQASAAMTEVVTEQAATEVMVGLKEAMVPLMSALAMVLPLKEPLLGQAGQALRLLGAIQQQVSE
jgi:hypothetical protein